MSSTPSAPLPPRSGKSNTTKPSKPKKRTSGWKKFVYFLLLAIVAGCVWYFVEVSKALDEAVNGMSDSNAPEVPETEAADKVPRTILMLGVDYRKETGSYNTDVIMIASLHPETKKATLVSIPRDTKIDPEGWRAGKANSFYAAALSENNNDRRAAMEDVKQIFSNYMNIQIDYVSVVNFNAFERIIDELGGVELYVDMDMKYVDRADGTNIDLKKGTQELNGEDALDFVRYRKSNRGTQESSDYERNERQQRLLAALLDKMKSVKTVQKLPDIINALGDNIRTDIPQGQLKQFFYTYVGLSPMGSSDVEYLPIEGVWKSPYVYLDEAKLAEAKQALQNRLAGVTANSGDTTGEADSNAGATE